jgi:hypothetical protein
MHIKEYTTFFEQQIADSVNVTTAIKIQVQDLYTKIPKVIESIKEKEIQYKSFSKLLASQLYLMKTSYIEDPLSDTFNPQKLVTTGKHWIKHIKLEMDRRK